MCCSQAATLGVFGDPIVGRALVVLRGARYDVRSMRHGRPLHAGPFSLALVPVDNLSDRLRRSVPRSSSSPTTAVLLRPSNIRRYNAHLGKEKTQSVEAKGPPSYQLGAQGRAEPVAPHHRPVRYFSDSLWARILRRRPEFAKMPKENSENWTIHSGPSI
jgi:hypothetical protein